MKKWFSRYRSYMVRPILYKCLFRAAIGLVGLLLWKRLVIDMGRSRLLLMRDGCFIVGMIFVCLAWFAYLHLDGVRFSMGKKNASKKKTQRGGSDLVDFADEHIISFEELCEEERSCCSLTAYLLCAVMYLLVAIVGIYLKI